MKEDGDVEFSSPKPHSAFQTIPEGSVVKSVTTAPGGSVLIPHTITTVTLCSNSPNPFSGASVAGGSGGVPNGNGSSSSLLVHRGPASSSQVPINSGASVIAASNLASQQQLQSHSFYITQQQSTNSKGPSEGNFAQGQPQSAKGLGASANSNGTSQHPQLTQAQSVSSQNFSNLSSNRNTPTQASSFSGKPVGTTNGNNNPTVPLQQHSSGAHLHANANANNHLNTANNNNVASNHHNGNTTTYGNGSALKNANNQSNSHVSNFTNGNVNTNDITISHQQHTVFSNANNQVNVISSVGSGNITLATSNASGASTQVPVASLSVPNNCQIPGTNNNNGSSVGGTQTGTMLQQQPPPMNLSFPRIPPSPDSALGGWSTPSSNLSRHNSDASQRSFSSSSNNTTPPSPSNSPLLSHSRVVNKVDDYGKCWYFKISNSKSMSKPKTSRFQHLQVMEIHLKYYYRPISRPRVFRGSN